MRYLFMLILTFTLQGFPHHQKAQFEQKKISIKLSSSPKATVTGRLTAVHMELLINRFYTTTTTDQLIFPAVTRYPHIDFYELTIIYQGITYYHHLSPEQLFNREINIPLYQMGNIKAHLSIAAIDLIIEPHNGMIWITEDLTINNRGAFTYSPLLPQSNPGMKRALPDGVTTIEPLFNLSKKSYTIQNNQLTLLTFLKPGLNHFSYRYTLPLNRSFHYITQNMVQKLRVILPDPLQHIKSNYLKNFQIRESQSGKIKLATTEKIPPGTGIDFTLSPPASHYSSRSLQKLLSLRFPHFPALIAFILSIFWLRSRQKHLYLSTTRGKEDRSLSGNIDE